MRQSCDQPQGLAHASTSPSIGQRSANTDSISSLRPPRKLVHRHECVPLVTPVECRRGDRSTKAMPTTTDAESYRSKKSSRFGASVVVAHDVDVEVASR